MITAILNCYKRPEYLAEQVNALRNQSVAPEEIWVWVNQTEENKDFDFDKLEVDRVVVSNHNFKYHGRFALGLLASTEYIAFFDDDTIPGAGWLSNCLSTMNETEGLLGGNGVTMEGRNYMTQKSRAGWMEKTPETTEVDLVGHAWFLKREWLGLLWAATPISLENGEDIQLSFFLQRFGGIKTYVPAQDTSYKSSSIKGEAYGSDDKASWLGRASENQGEFYRERQRIVDTCLSNGWKTVRGVTL